MRTSRLQDMEAYILDRGTVTMDELLKKYGISINTLRADLNHLAERGSIKKVYGGVCSNEKNSLVPFEERQTKNTWKKAAVGRLAATMVEDGDIIFLDSGTTTMFLLDHIPEDREITVLTHNLNAIIRALPYPNIQVICLPGTLDRKTNSFTSTDIVGTFRQYNIKKAFMACSGVLENGTVTNASPLEFGIKQAAVKYSGQAILMLDSTKFGQSALLSYASLSDMDAVLVDPGAGSDLKALCKQRKVPLYQADQKEE